MAEFAADKKHAPTAMRRKKARQEGHVAHSSDLTSALLLLVALGAIWMVGGRAVSQLSMALSESLASPVIADYDASTASHQMLSISLKAAVSFAPILLAMFAIAILVHLIQTGMAFSPKRVMPSLNHVNPMSGLQKLFSIASLIRLGFGLVKVAAIVAVSYAAMRSYGTPLMSLGAMSLSQMCQVLFQCVTATCFWIGLSLLGFAIVDYGYQRFRLERELMMTDEELREELKDIEGDPTMFEHRRELQQKLAMSRS